MLAKTKRLLAMVLTVCLVMGFMPVGVAATGGAGEPRTSAQQIEKDGTKYLYYGENGFTTTDPVKTIINEAKAPGLYVEMEKSITATKVENEFLINLRVETNSVVSETSRLDAAVVLVLDTSSSMVYNKQANSGTKPALETRRLYKAIQAINQFIDEFANLEDDDENIIPGERWVSIVGFNSSATTLKAWANVGPQDTQEAQDAAIAGMKLTYENIDTAGSTNIAAGLERAVTQLNSLNKPDITSKSVVLLTDGVPNTGNQSITDIPGLNYSDLGGHYKRAENQAFHVRSQANLFTVAYGNDLQNDSGGTIGWLSNYIATMSSYAKSGGDDLDLSAVFTTIRTQIEAAAKAWVINDPMGQHIEYLDVTDPAHGQVTGLTYDEASNSIEWDLKDTEFDSEDGIVKVYELQYKIRLDTLAIPTADWDILEGTSEYYLTNGRTTLQYSFEKIEDEEVIVLASGTEEFYVPAVQGYCAPVKIEKKIENSTNSVAGFDFILVHSSNCGCGHGAVQVGGTRTSGENGLLTFANVPSGHRYTLEETDLLPEFNVPSPVFVDILWGEVYYNGTCTNVYHFVNSYKTPGIAVNKMVISTDIEGNEVVLVDNEDAHIVTNDVFDINTPIIFKIDFTVENVNLTGIVVDEDMEGAGRLVGPFMSLAELQIYRTATTVSDKAGLVKTAEDLLTTHFGVGNHSLYYYYVATPADSGKILTNNVTITGKADDYDDVDDTDDETIEILGPNVQISKVVNPTAPSVEIDDEYYQVYGHGSNIQYTITVTNYGDQVGTATGITVSDTMADADKAQDAEIWLPGAAAVPFTFKTDEPGNVPTVFSLAPYTEATITYTVTLENDDATALAAYNAYVAEQTKIIKDATDDLALVQAKWDAANAERTELGDTIAELQQKIDDFDDTFLTPAPTAPVEPIEVTQPNEADYEDEGVLDQAAYEDACDAYDQYLIDHAQWVVDYARYEAEYAIWLEEKADFDAYPDRLAQQLLDAQEALADLAEIWTSDPTAENPDPADFDLLDQLEADIADAIKAIEDATAMLAKSKFEPGKPAIVGNTATVEAPEYKILELDTIEVAVNAKPKAAICMTKEVSVDGSNYSTSATFPDHTAGIAYYRVTVTNDGNAPAKYVMLTDSMAGSATNISVDGTDIHNFPVTFSVPVGASVVITYQVRIDPNPSFDARATHVNTATLTVGEEEISNHAYVNVPPAPYAKLDIEKVIVLERGEGPGSDIVADTWTYYTDDEVTVRYRVTVKNTGNAAGTFTITDDVLADDETVFGTTITLEKGEERVFYYTLTLDKTTTNTATYSMPTGGREKNETGDDDATAVIKPMPKARISLTKQVRLDAEGTTFDDKASATVATRNGTADFIFRITITNTGDADVSVTGIADEMIDSGSLLGEDATKYLVPKDLAEMNAPFILPGVDAEGVPGTKTFYVSAKGVPVGTFTNTATVATGSVDAINPRAIVIWAEDELDMIKDSAEIEVTRRFTTTEGDTTGPTTGPTTEPTTEPEEEIDTTTPVTDFTEPATTAPAEDEVYEEEEVVLDDVLADLPATGVLTTPVDPAWTLGALAVMSSLGIIIKMGKKKEEQQ